MAVKIYIYSAIKTPRRSSGKIAYAIDPYDIARVLERYDVNMYQAEMLALYMALQEAAGQGGMDEIDIYTESAYIKNALTSTVPKVAQTGWHNSKGEPIRNADAWKSIWELIKSRKYHVHLNEDHEYKKWFIENTAKPLFHICNRQVCNKNTKSV